MEIVFIMEIVFMDFLEHLGKIIRVQFLKVAVSGDKVERP